MYQKPSHNCFSVFYTYLFMLKILFIYLSVRESAPKRGGRGRGRHRPPTEQGAGLGTRSQDPEGRGLMHGAPQAPLGSVFRSVTRSEFVFVGVRVRYSPYPHVVVQTLSSVCSVAFVCLSKTSV